MPYPESASEDGVPERAGKVGDWDVGGTDDAGQLDRVGRWA